MKDPELDLLIDTLETRTDLTIADFDAVVHALDFLLPDKTSDAATAQRISGTDGAMQVADDFYPDWAVHIHGRANDKDGHWRCTMRESDVGNGQAITGTGRSPVLAQAILAAMLRVSMRLTKQEPTA